MFRIYLCVVTQHDWRLLVSAALVCAVSACATFFLYARVPAGPPGLRALWVGMTAMVAGSGIWTTHFVAMLAFKTGLPASYGPSATFGSLIIAVAGTAVGFAVASAKPASKGPTWSTVGGGGIVGLGIALMHYVGMLGYRTEGVIQWDPAYVSASIVIGAMLGAAALWVGRPGAAAWRRFAAAGLLSLGIIGMHFTGMAAVAIRPDASVTASPAALPETAMAAAAIGGMALILTTVMVGALFGAFSRESNLKRLTEALDVMPEAVGVYDSDERLVAWNARFAELWGEVGSVVVGWSIEDMVRDLLAQNVFPESGQGEAALAQELADFRSGSSLKEMETSDGRWVRVTHRRTRGGFTVTTAVNISDLKQAGVDMARARDEAEAANRAKSEFLANMSHEIRTPMNGIMGMNSLMLLSPLTDEQRLYAETVQSSAESLLGILNDILDMSKLEAGKVTLEAIAFSFQDLARDVVRSVTPSANAKGLALSYEAPDGLFLGDPGRIRQVLLNLVSNGVKFTEKGSVEIRIRSRSAGQRAQLRIEVADTGIGLSDETKAKLFQPFQQADASITRRFGGTGLGLSICRQLVELMEGRIGVEDHSGGGSTFWFELSLERAQEAELALRQAG